MRIRSKHRRHYRHRPNLRSMGIWLLKLRGCKRKQTALHFMTKEHGMKEAVCRLMFTGSSTLPTIDWSDI